MGPKVIKLPKILSENLPQNLPENNSILGPKVDTKMDQNGDPGELANLVGGFKSS